MELREIKLREIGIVTESNEEIMKRLEILENKIDMLIECVSGNIVPNCNKMNNHIDFIDRTYEKMRSPLNYICSIVKGSEEGVMLKDKNKTLEIEDK